jgi:hypothetical protein
MKKIILINYLFLIAVNCLIAQEQADFFTQNLDAYVGTWEYTDGNCTFRIYLKKGKSYYSKGGPLMEEIVYGGHYIERNGVVITDLEKATKWATDEDNRMTIVAGNGKKEESQVNPNVLTFVFKDKLKEKGGAGKLTLIPGNPAQLRWHIQKTRERPNLFLIVGEPMPVREPGWTVPEDVILTKISDTRGEPRPPFGGYGEGLEIEG